MSAIAQTFEDVSVLDLAALRRMSYAELDELYRNATTADEAADIAFEAIAEGRFYAFTTKSFDGAIRQRADDILARANPLFEDIVAMSRRDAGLDDASLDQAHAK